MLHFIPNCNIVTEIVLLVKYKYQIGLKSGSGLVKLDQDIAIYMYFYGSFVAGIISVNISAFLEFPVVA